MRRMGEDNAKPAGMLPPPLGRRGGYVRMSIEDRRQAVKELAGEGESNRGIARLLGVDESTVREDKGAGNPAVDADEASSNAVDSEASAGNPAPLTAVAALAADEKVPDASSRAVVCAGPSVTNPPFPPKSRQRSQKSWPEAVGAGDPAPDPVRQDLSHRGPNRPGAGRFRFPRQFARRPTVPEGQIGHAVADFSTWRELRRRRPRGCWKRASENCSRARSADAEKLTSRRKV